MQKQRMSRRDFLGQAALLTGAVSLGSGQARAASSDAPRRTAVDQVPLGRTGLRISRLGIGTGSNSGQVQFALGAEGFHRLIRYAYDRGITYIDAAQGYRTFEWIGGAIKGLPREKLFLQTKVPGKPANVLEAIDRHRKTFQTDYIDSLLIHCMVRGNWTEDMKRIMDGFEEAQQKQWIRLKGVSCHSLPALRAATESSWTQVHLVRVNPQAKHVDGDTESWNQPGNQIEPVLEQIRAMHAKGRGVIGMKIIGNGDFTQPEDREKSIRFAMACREIDAVVIGFKSPAEIDEAIERMNRALAGTA
ncbi:MAG: aldo/keto reductase [Verrucomicrobia bacterium]|nr:aldo/keto reductase [Verrucomicrobiota bacterium]